MMKGIKIKLVYGIVVLAIVGLSVNIINLLSREPEKRTVDLDDSIVPKSNGALFTPKLTYQYNPNLSEFHSSFKHSFDSYKCKSFTEDQLREGQSKQIITKHEYGLSILSPLLTTSQFPPYTRKFIKEYDEDPERKSFIIVHADDVYKYLKGNLNVENTHGRSLFVLPMNKNGLEHTVEDGQYYFDNVLEAKNGRLMINGMICSKIMEHTRNKICNLNGATWRTFCACDMYYPVLSVVEDNNLKNQYKEQMENAVDLKKKKKVEQIFRKAVFDENFMKDFYSTNINVANHIAILKCAYIDGNSVHSDVYGMVFNEDGFRITDPTDVRLFRSFNSQVRVYKELASIDFYVYADSFGHSPYEILPRLVRLWFETPSHIPIVLPDGKFTLKIMSELIQAGMLEPKDRPIVLRQSDTLYAEKLYTDIQSSKPAKKQHIIMYQNTLFLKRKLIELMQNRNKEKYENMKKRNRIKVMLLNREPGSSRYITNMGEIKNELIKEIGESKIEIVEYRIREPTWLGIGDKIFDVDVLVGPHGANLMNTIFMEAGKVVVEVGFINSFILPSDYFGLASQTGMYYYCSIAEGGYGSPLTANVPDVLQIVKDSLNYF